MTEAHDAVSANHKAAAQEAQDHKTAWEAADAKYKEAERLYSFREEALKGAVTTTVANASREEVTVLQDELARTRHELEQATRR